MALCAARHNPRGIFPSDSSYPTLSKNDRQQEQPGGYGGQVIRNPLKAQRVAEQLNSKKVAV
ncbi:TPA: DUF1317 family protein [Klebsiella quasipneumoniae]